MSEAAAANAPATPAAKKERVVQKVTMTDGREVEFAGTRRSLREYLLDESKIQLDEQGGMLVIQPGAVSVRSDFLNGETRTNYLPLSLFCRFAGHGASQKTSDNLATSKDKALSLEDMVIATDDLWEQFYKGLWSEQRESDGFAGAGIVIRAIMEATGKPQDFVKAFLSKKLEASKAAADADASGKTKPLSRKDLYDSFRNPNSKIGQIIDRLEKERLASTAKIDADSTLEEMMAAA